MSWAPVWWRGDEFAQHIVALIGYTCSSSCVPLIIVLLSTWWWWLGSFVSGSEEEEELFMERIASAWSLLFLCAAGMFRLIPHRFCLSTLATKPGHGCADALDFLYWPKANPKPFWKKNYSYTYLPLVRIGNVFNRVCLLNHLSWNFVLKKYIHPKFT